MQKDLKIGLILGLILVIFIGLRLVTDPRLSTKARMEKIHEAESENDSQNPLTSNQDTQNQLQNIDDNQVTGIESPIQQSRTKTNDSLINELDGPGITPGQTIKDSSIEPAGNNTEAQDTVANKETEVIKTQNFHIVQSGDTLSGISQKYYGTANKWPNILEANRNVLKDPNKLQLGMKLIIPQQ